MRGYVDHTPTNYQSNSGLKIGGLNMEHNKQYLKFKEQLKTNYKLQNAIAEGIKAGSTLEEAVEFAAYNVEIELEKEKQELKEKQKEAIIKSNSKFSKLCGVFYFCFYGNEKIEKLKPEHLFRACMLASYMDYNENLVIGNTNSRHTMTNKEMMDVLDLKPNAFIETKKELKNAGILIEKDGVFKFKPSCFGKGEIKGIKKENYAMICESGIREIYAQVGAREHRRWGLIMKLMPYVNIHHSILCSPDCINEEIRELIIPLTLDDLCEKLNIDKRKKSRLKNDILSVKVSSENIKYRAILFLEDKDRTEIIINPRLYYKGDDERLGFIMELFMPLSS